MNQNVTATESKVMNRDQKYHSEGDPFQEKTLNKLRLLIYLLPVVGWIPSLWTSYRRQGNPEELSVSRLSVTLTLLWGVSYALLWLGSLQTSELFTLRLLYLNGLLTSGYLLISLGLILRVLQGKPVSLPFVSGLSKKILKKN